jgi:hypothetical protein
MVEGTKWKESGAQLTPTPSTVRQHSTSPHPTLAQSATATRTIDERVATGLDAGPHSPPLITTEPEPSSPSAESISPAGESTSRTKEPDSTPSLASTTSSRVSCTVPEITPMSGESTVSLEESTMNKDQRAAQRRCRRVRDFLTQHPKLGSVADLAKQTQVLDEVLAGLPVLGEEQDANLRQARAETSRQRALRTTLRYDHMAPISKVARLLRGSTGIDRALVMPTLSNDNDALIDAARGMAQAAAKQSAVFIGQGMAVDFVEQLRAATSALADVLGARVESQRRGIVARQSIDELVQRGTTAVNMLDALVTPLLSQDADLLRAWRTVKRPIEPGGVQSDAAPQQSPAAAGVQPVTSPAEASKAA